ncbi:MAG: glycerol-3-phosphate acyltransferase [Thiobacillus sp. 63-78]|uniref:glycerol-3-phosphate 1-O-acyltransferase PlsY n=1 Tax=Thiobacillus sp. 63-78 TaxID=1895859 RepID=UPI00086A044F|nr:glycerol-3-phosphate 1-O-acyltransferase PlsY [Thiobacillus sp. 63-78]MBN8762595.1 glycerol-3-phosphate 1-O-acyltransferase PlsY [Thiobacillus sp.]ODV14113.1 MAG: glycerol-3-phosphate acyltransferase [Thiobacillus sp. SCN 64-317]MBN8766020.1 glycerol-3-phosphate 1-O-acyltransferase PlsY [Thiobacillus sp.]MBN8774421.1 glycerol-3-phosphate 1-O-acyltransferase PlsY [Thiobacillus sp.]OJZ15797.1 MAG: glycerol-3-phosphate acyltransferase [Thiobacillus sp. 63-78]
MTLLLFIVAAYLLGSLSFAVIVSRAMRLPDPRSFGSGNPGATNVLRTGHKAAAALTLLGDALKGWVAVVLARMLAPQFGLPEESVLLCALAVFIGHLFPVFFRFKGGKGVATALGVLLGLNPWLGLACLATWLFIARVFRISSLAALITAVLAPVYSGLLTGWGSTTIAVSVIALLLFYRHKSNLIKLISGQEGRIGIRS